MCLVVVDPRLLVRAFEHPQTCRVAKLLGLFMYGRICLNEHGVACDEAEQLEVSYHGVARDGDLAAVRARAERDRADAIRRKALMDDAFVEHAPSDLLLVTSSPLLSELRKLADEAGLQPDLVNHQIASCTAKWIRTLDPPPFDLGPGRKSDHEYLIRTAVQARANNLITHDEDLTLVGDAAHIDPKTRNEVRPYSLDEFVQLVLPYYFTLDAVDAPAVLRAASRPLS